MTALDYSIRSEFWPGFVLVLERSDPETKWDHLDRILDLGQVQFLVQLGFFSNAENCSKLIENYLSETKKSETKKSETEKSEARIGISLEQISTKVVESIGGREAMKILIEKSSKFRPGTFSPG